MMVLLALVMCLVLNNVIPHVTAYVYQRHDILTPAIRNMSDYNCGDNPYSNGCSVPFRYYRKQFQSECNKHDICYACGAEYGISRRYCDIDFRHNIADRCSALEDDKTWCHIITYMSYAAVRLKGHRRYSKHSPSWCTQNWVPHCLYIDETK